MQFIISEGRKSVYWLRAVIKKERNMFKPRLATDLSRMQRVFLQSKANGCSYRGDELLPAPKQWPENTWLRQRLLSVGRYSPKPSSRVTVRSDITLRC